MVTIIIQVSQVSDGLSKPGCVGITATELKLRLQQFRLGQSQFMRKRATNCFSKSFSPRHFNMSQ